jgi:hypothetical protein
LLFNEELAEIMRLERNSESTISINKNYNTVNHAPKPQYLFSYENPLIECNSCHNKVKLSDIREEYPDEGGMYLICPICKRIDTFEVKHEKIEDVI